MRIERLKRRADFLKLKSGLKWTTPAFILQARQRDETAERAEAPARIGFTVSDRAISLIEPGGKRRGGAVKRNRARRRLKEAARLTAENYSKPGFDYVLIGRMDALTRDFADLLADMKVAFHKVHTMQLRPPARSAQINEPQRRSNAAPEQGTA